MSISPYIRKTATSVIIATMALSLTPAIAHAAPANNAPPAPSTPSIPTLPNGEQRYIIKYKDNVNAEAKSKSLKEKGVKVKDTLVHSFKASVVEATPSTIESLKNSPDVEAIELDVPVSISGATSLWGLDRIDQRTGRDGQYNISNEGAGVNVYVADTGLNLSHTEFTGRVPAQWNGIHDGQGINDCNGHGTHVAGTVAGTTYGVANKANIIPMRVLDCDGTGWSSTIISSVDWAIAHHTDGTPAVMNLSIGGFVSSMLDAAIEEAIADGITVVAAAGNSNKDACESSPARVPTALTVAATDINDAEASFSNYGSCVDLHAPGVSIKSAYKDGSTSSINMSGTSMATPHVAGAAAVMLSRTPSLTPAQVHQNVLSGATTNVVTAIKGTTPNKLLFLQALTTSSAPNATHQTLDAIDSSGTLWRYNAPGNGTVGSRTKVGAGWGNAKQILKVDWNSDGILDIVARWGSGSLTMYAGTGNNAYSSPITLGSAGWQDYDINAVKLKKTDKYPGIVARNISNGYLYYYPNTGGKLTSRTLMGSGWKPMTELNALDWDGNGNIDIIARNSAGELRLYRTNGAGAFVSETRAIIGKGWNGMSHIAIQPDFTGAGSVGIIARNSSGSLIYYPISNGKFLSAKTVGNGWNGYNIAAAGAP